MENMASTWATALFNVAPAGEAALQPCPWAGVFLGGSPEGGSLCRRGAQPCTSKQSVGTILWSSAAHPVTRNRWGQWGLCRGSLQLSTGCRSGRVRRTALETGIRGKQKCLCHKVRREVKVAESCPTLCDPLSPGQNTGVGGLCLLQGIFPTQGLNPGLPHCRHILYQLSHKGSPEGIKGDAERFLRFSLK